MADHVEQYLETVGEQVRWKRAREGLIRELRTHLLDQQDAFLLEGMTQEEAQRESVRQMGDPVEAGTRLDRIHRPRPQWGLLALVGVLLCMGYAAQTLLRDVAVTSGLYDAGFYESRWLLSAVIGAAVMLGVYFMDYTLLARRPLGCFFAGVAVFAVVLQTSHKFGGRAYEIQYYMLFAPVLLAVLVYGMRGRGWYGFFFVLAAALALTTMACMIPNVTLAVLILCSGFVLMTVSVVRGWMGVSLKKGMAVLGGLVAAAAVLFACAASYSEPISRRIQFALHPELDPLGAGYHATIIRSLLAQARWIGRGSVNFDGGDAAQLLPAIPGSSILTWMIHCLGWAAGLAVIGVFVLMLGWMARKAARQRGMLGCLVSLAVVMILAAQVLTFVVFNMGFCLTGTLSLPLISYGKGFVIGNMALIGLALSVFREEALPLAESRCAGTAGKDREALIFWHDGDLVIGLSRFKNIKSA